MLLFSVYIGYFIGDDVYRTDREVDRYKSSNSLTQLEDIITTYLMYNVDLGKSIA